MSDFRPAPKASCHTPKIPILRRKQTRRPLPQFFSSLLGQQAFAGTTTMDAETHIGLGTLDHKLIVGATLAGYDATPDNPTKLVAVARMQGAAAKRIAGVNDSR